MAKITYAHAGDHAVVAFTGELDWDAVRELVDIVELLVQDYFYTTVELLVTSPGGNVRAFEYYLGRQAEWRRHGVSVRTHVFSEAGSAAALLVSLGDERVADPGATLSYHCAHMSPEGVNAETTAAISLVLREMDEGFIARLASRGLKGRAEVEHAAERADRALLRQLWPEFGRKARRGGKAPAKVRKLAQAIGRYVDQAVRGGDGDALARLYRRIFETECRISARLALTLRLIDRIGPEPPAAAKAPAGDEGLTVPEWAVLYPPDGTVPRGALTRHTLVLGETGSGKTASCILPVVAAMARAPRERLGASLVIDPKRELARTLQALAPERLHRVEAERAVLNVMSGPRWDLHKDLEAERWVSAARRILCRAASFVPSNPAKVLLRYEPAGTSNKDFFDRQGTALAQAVLALVLMLIHPRTPAPGQWLEDDVEAFSWVDDLLARARGLEDGRGPNVMALAAWALEGPLLVHTEPQRAVTIPAQPEEQKSHSGWVFGRVAHAALVSLCDESPEGRDLCLRVLGYWAAMGCAESQQAGVRATASTVAADFAAPSIARSLYFGCEPGYASARSNGDGLEFARLVAADGPGTLVLFQPARDGLDNLIAVALKALFFEAVLDDSDRSRGRTDLPLVGYVADEFHRFVTSDVVHGEQSFLDTCRSYSTACFLACQSVASIEHALAHGGGNAEQNRSSVEILWQNTATKIVFRSTDSKTAERVGNLAPSRSGLDPVVRVRPVSTLAPGECYAVLADGRFERRQLGRFVEPEKAPSQPVAALAGPARAGGRS